MKRFAILGACALFAACEPGRPGLDTHGDAPLVLDLDVESPITVSDTAESGGTISGPDKGKGQRGGLSGSFITNGGPVCVIIDPEGTFLGGGTSHLDDGDIDLFVGRAADYTGTPGINMGEFAGEYVDPLGVSHVLNQNLCTQYDYYGLPGAHAGAAAPEYCERLETDAGVPYLAVGETFAVPPDDGLLTVALQVRAGVCPATILESTLDSDFN